MRTVNFSRSVKVLTSAFKKQSSMIATRLYNFDKCAADSYNKLLERSRSLESSVSDVDASVSHLEKDVERLDKSVTRLMYSVLILGLSMFLDVLFHLLN